MIKRSLMAAALVATAAGTTFVSTPASASQCDQPIATFFFAGVDPTSDPNSPNDAVTQGFAVNPAAAGCIFAEELGSNADAFYIVTPGAVVSSTRHTNYSAGVNYEWTYRDNVGSNIRFGVPISGAGVADWAGTAVEGIDPPNVVESPAVALNPTGTGSLRVEWRANGQGVAGANYVAIANL